MRRFLWAAALACAAWGMAAGVHAKDAPLVSSEPELDKRVVAVTSELRCLVCQNETIAASSADLAVDLRNQVREMLRKGQSEKEIIDYMTARYGDFVLYRPPVRNTTALLWFGPPLLMGVGLLTLWLVLRRRSRLSADQFEDDEADEADAAPTPAAADRPRDPAR
jgi:cytochrome c-type biogenesis protein CcmH